MNREGRIERNKKKTAKPGCVLTVTALACTSL